MYLPPALFERQLDSINSRFHIISVSQLLNGQYKKPAALITFDDGFRSYFETAVPLMTARGIPSINFLNMEPVEGGVFWSGLITYLSEFEPDFAEYVEGFSKNDDRPTFLCCTRQMVSAYLEKHPDSEEVLRKVRRYYGRFARIEDLERAAGNDLVSFGNHLYNHYNVANLTDDELKNEFLKNDRKLFQYPNTVKAFSYPFGQPESCFAPRHTEIIKQLGSQAVFFSSGGVNFRRKKTLYDRVVFRKSLNSLEDFLLSLIKRKLKKFINTPLSEIRSLDPIGFKP